MHTVGQFYNHLSEIYNDTTFSKERFIKEKKFFESVLKNRKISSALDAGAGTGFHSTLLASLGIEVTAVDTSAKMLSILKQNAGEQKIKTIHSDFLSLHRLKDKYDLIVCMGNSLPHSSPKERIKILKIFYRLLNPDGMIIIQTINYKNILDNKFKIQNIKKLKDKTIIRFYDLVGNKIYFNFILIPYNAKGKNQQKINSILHHPIQKNDFKNDLTKARFKDIVLYGDMAFSSFNENISTDIIALAQKNI
ncbi:MAG: class I SAM-dependent methyltransferase [Ignavibacteriales bacterium]|nr:class I SAM-dependent methyltransferase [Ignavibacteriales bacterium]